LILFQNMSYNELASVDIDQEGTMRACEASEEKKKKRTMPGSSGGSSSGAPLKYCMIYMHPWDSRVDLRSFGATAHSSSSSSNFPTLHLCHSSRW
jgi:hypothetical protein